MIGSSIEWGLKEIPRKLRGCGGHTRGPSNFGNRQLEHGYIDCSPIYIFFQLEYTLDGPPIHSRLFDERLRNYTVGDPKSSLYHTKSNMSESADSKDRCDVEKQPVSDHQVMTADKSTKDPKVVDWDGPDDPENPMNWPTSKKVTAIGLVSLITVLS